MSLQLRPVDPRTIGVKGLGLPLLKEFMESDELMAAIEQGKKSQQGLTAMRNLLTYHIKARDLPVYVFQHNSELYLMRLDREMLDDGTVIDVPNWREVKQT